MVNDLQIITDRDENTERTDIQPAVYEVKPQNLMKTLSTESLNEMVFNPK